MEVSAGCSLQRENDYRNHEKRTQRAMKVFTNIYTRRNIASGWLVVGFNRPYGTPVRSCILSRR